MSWYKVHIYTRSRANKRFNVFAENFQEAIEIAEEKFWQIHKDCILKIATIKVWLAEKHQPSPIKKSSVVNKERK